MAKPKILILRTAGTNCDKETAYAFESVGADITFAHINMLFRNELNLSSFQMLMLSGGFSYGDDIAAGKVLANELKFKLGNDIESFVKEGKLVLGICNGFQILVKCGLLPGFESVDTEQKVTLSFNDSDKFECRWICLKKEKNNSPFLKYVPDIIRVPIAHGEGKFVVKDKSILDIIENNNQVAFRYVDEKGEFGDYPINPNGSINSIAGITNKQGNVLGMMPHPERFFHSYQDPQWTNRELKEHGDGFYLFKSAVEYLMS